MGETAYRDWLDEDEKAEIAVRFLTHRREVADYAVVLLSVERGDRRTVRVYDNAHGNHDMHRYNRADVKQAAQTFHQGSAGGAMRSAIEAIRGGYEEMIESWRR
ncbi:MAG TPA: hypothetical protein VG147_09285 [Solirubrobacteraceae bacterium]|nr:hypothetical protein [Solirubrobacteraceae bacterium]